MIVNFFAILALHTSMTLAVEIRMIFAYKGLKEFFIFFLKLEECRDDKLRNWINGAVVGQRLQFPMTNG